MSSTYPGLNGKVVSGAPADATPMTPLMRVTGRSVPAVLGLWLAASVVLGHGRMVRRRGLADHQAQTLGVVLLVHLLLPLAALAVQRPAGVRGRLALRAASPRAYRLAALTWLIALAALAAAYGVYGLIIGDAAAPLLAWCTTRPTTAASRRQARWTGPSS
ncbi:hypothetical protein GCM10010211_82170 [Streptomyces albospinus]|uniref:Integral membrane protein n=1 Tax=Streptomyces albospinus TaxID=285515 RepID=A0ABQ2VQS7_9ACTN|nr:hypothetical protein [Streptomyces albospinus]GGV02395.1 hypothetical protein GCM10010211_82170 [Streptomyces albospinus]